jgi:hypothetical protein
LLHVRRILGRTSEAAALTAMERSVAQSKFKRNSIYLFGSDVHEEINGLILAWAEIYLKWIITTVHCAGVL